MESKSEKEKLIKYMEHPVTTKARNIMGCSENWYNSYYAISETFSQDEILNMSEEEILHLVKLAETLSESLY